MLRRAGAEPVLVPLIELMPPDDGGAALAAAAHRLGDYDWLICTSANGADRLMEALEGTAVPAGLQVAAIGPTTAAALAAGGVTVALLPERYVAESLLDAFGLPGDVGSPAAGEPAAAGGGVARPGAPRASQASDAAERRYACRVLLVRAAVARDVLPDGLRARGWSVDIVAAYRAVPRRLAAGERAIAASCDTVIFTSPSVVDAFCDQPDPLPVPPTVAAIGPVTAAAARRRGLTVHVEATDHTVEGLVAALCRHAGAAVDY